jgi:hypothetical protein
MDQDQTLAVLSMVEPRYTVEMEDGGVFVVIDRARSNSIDGDFTFCKCWDGQSAEDIAAAMNMVDALRR